MTTFRNRLVIMALAALLPIIILVSVLVVILAQHERLDVAADVRERTRRIAELVDRETAAEIRELSALATARSLDDGDLAAFYDQASRVKGQSPPWVTVTLADPDGTVLLSLLHPFGAAPGRVVDPASFETVMRTLQPATGGISPPGPVEGRRLIAMRVPVIRDRVLKYVLTAAVSQTSIQALLDGSALPPSWGAAIVDRDGAIVARLPFTASLIGGPASESALRARAQGSEGIYDAVTLEGRRMVATFGVSALTGWSVHLGVPEEEFNRWFTRSIWLAAGGGVGSIALLVALFVLVFREVAQYRRAEAGLRQTQKMEALGQMTGGIAHDFNNLLMVMVGNVALVEASAGIPAEARGQLAAALKAAQRGAVLIRQLLAFARRQVLQPQIVEPNRLITEFEPLVRHAAGDDVVLRYHLAPGLGACRLDVAQFEAAILNLVVNARDAMADGGTITIETLRANLDDRPAAASLGIEPGDYVLVRVADTGTGMLPEVISKAFEPFFTTKEVGKGSGLGLSMVYGFVKQSGGYARIESEVGVGTSVSLYLPRAVARAPSGDDAAAL